MDEETDVLFDLNLDSIRLDFLLSSLEKQYQLNMPLIFNRETATLGGLAFCINKQCSDN
jgi:acyl carrier protein